MQARAEVEFIVYFILVGTVYTAAFRKEDYSASEVIALTVATYLIRRGVE